VKLVDHVSISDDAKGRVLVVYGKVTENGIGLCIEDTSWGQFALLPRKYEYLLYPPRN